MAKLSESDFIKVREEKLKNLHSVDPFDETGLLKDGYVLVESYYSTNDNEDEYELAIYQKGDTILAYNLFVKNTASEGPLNFAGYFSNKKQTN